MQFTTITKTYAPPLVLTSEDTQVPKYIEKATLYQRVVDHVLDIGQHSDVYFAVVTPHTSAEVYVADHMFIIQPQDKPPYRVPSVAVIEIKARQIAENVIEQIYA